MNAAVDHQALTIDVESQTGAQALVAALAAAGVDTVFGYPGGAIMPTYDALLDVSDDLRHVLVRHEQGAVHAAQGYARATGRPAACLVTSGPGATNLITGMADALMDSTPVICICGQVVSGLLGSDAFQEADIVGMSLSATKWSYQIVDPRETAAVVRTAIAIATDGRPGPVLIDITRDAQLGHFCADEACEPRMAPAPDAADAAANWDLGEVAAAADLLNAARRPLMLVGQGVLLAGAEREAINLAERADLPIASTLLGLSAVPTGHPNYVGLLGMHGNYAPNQLTNEADVILAVGMRFDDRVTGRVDGYAPDAKIVHIEIDPAEIDRHVPAAVAVVRDAREALARLLPMIQPNSHPRWRARFAALDAEEHRRITIPELDRSDGPLRMTEAVGVLSECTEGQALVVTDVGQHQMFVARYYRFARRGSHVTSGGLGTMGFALPAAVGAVIAAPDRTVLAISGDGGFQMNVQELGTVAQEQLPVKMVILNNQYLGMVRQWQELFFSSRYSFVDMQSPDFVTLASAYGIPGRCVDERGELPVAVEQMLTADGPFLLEIKVAAEENVFPMVPAGGAISDIRLD